MLSKANHQDIELAAAVDVARKIDVTPKARKLIERKIWLPRIVYDGLPWFYLFAGIVALMATLYISAWFWVLPHYLLFSAGCLHLSIIVFRRRRTRKKHTGPATTDI